MALTAQDAGMTPIFYTEMVKDEAASRLAGRPIMVEQERIEYRFAANRNFNFHDLAHGFHQTVNDEVVTHAMRFPDEYRRFKETGGNIAKGIPLQNLPGLSPVQISTLKALSVYSIEALAALEGREVKNLGPGGSAMKLAAQKYLAAQSGQSDIATVLSEIAALKAKNEELERIVNASRPASVQEFVEADIDQSSPDPYAGIEDSVLKDMIEAKTQTRPRGNPSRPTLIGMLRDLEQGDAA